MGFQTQDLKIKTMLGKFLVIMLYMYAIVVKGEVYKVGDSAGWTANSNSNYTSWSYSKTFRVKDVLLFEYNATNDNVIEVTHSEFRSCNTSAPKRMFNSGNDSFTIKSPGHYYFTSNVSGHCQAGQKLDVRVLKHPIKVSPPSPITTPSPSPSPSPSVATVETKALAPSPEGNGVARHDPMWSLMSTFGVTLSGFAVLVHAHF